MTADKIAIIAEVENGALHPAVLDLAALAERMAAKGGDDVRWLAIGSRAAGAGERLARESGFPVTALEIAPDVPPSGELWQKVLQPVLADLRPDVIGLLHTSRSQDFAGLLAIALNAGCIAGIQGIVTTGHDVLFQRAVLGGRMLAEIRTDGRPAVVTVLPGYFKHEGRTNATATVTIDQPTLPATRVRLIEARNSESEAALRQAETIIAAGRGIGSEDNLALIDNLAACFPRSAVAGSRIVCDAGWMAYNRQVGVTGATVAPKLYVACGISGAPQHLGGMQGAELVVAINKDPHAAIFNVADIGVAEDLEVFLPLLIKAIEEL